MQAFSQMGEKVFDVLDTSGIYKTKKHTPMGKDGYGAEGNAKDVCRGINGGYQDGQRRDADVILTLQV